MQLCAGEGTAGVWIAASGDLRARGGAPRIFELAELLLAVAAGESGFVGLPLFTAAADEGVDAGGDVGGEFVVAFLMLFEEGARFGHRLAGAVAEFIDGRHAVSFRLRSCTGGID